MKTNKYIQVISGPGNHHQPLPALSIGPFECVKRLRNLKCSIIAEMGLQSFAPKETVIGGGMLWEILRITWHKDIKCFIKYSIKYFIKYLLTGYPVRIEKYHV